MLLQMQITSVLSTINVLLLLGIIWQNVQSYRKMKAEYTLFMIIFASLFLLEHAIGAIMFFTHQHYYVPEVSNHVLALTIIQTIAFAYLYWMERQ